MAYKVISYNIVTKKTTELVLLFHKKDNQASFPLPQYGPIMLESANNESKK